MKSYELQGRKNKVKKQRNLEESILDGTNGIRRHDIVWSEANQKNKKNQNEDGKKQKDIQE